MAIATTGRTKTRGRPVTGATKATVRKQGPAKAKGASEAGSAATKREELRARIEKLERANSTLRVKNKELRMAYVEAAETIDSLTLRLQSLERKAERQARTEVSNEAAAPRRGRRRPAGAAAGAGHTETAQDASEAAADEDAWA